MARNSEPSAVRPKSVTVMMFGWSRRLADSASRSKRRGELLVAAELGEQDLDRQIAAHHRVLGAVDRAHAADADAADDPVALADDGADEADRSTGAPQRAQKVSSSWTSPEQPTQPAI